MPFARVGCTVLGIGHGLQKALLPPTRAQRLLQNQARILTTPPGGFVSGVFTRQNFSGSSACTAERRCNSVGKTSSGRLFRPVAPPVGQAPLRVDLRSLGEPNGLALGSRSFFGKPSLLWAARSYIASSRAKVSLSPGDGARRRRRELSSSAGPQGLEGNGKLSAAVVGVGLPGRSIGWVHLMQLVEELKVPTLSAVEPWFRGPHARGTEAASEFEEFIRPLEADGRIRKVAQRVDEVKEEGVRSPDVVVVSGRTDQNPTLFEEAVLAGAKYILLEKPGADSVEKLERMKALAAEHNVGVCINFNKHVAPYALAAKKMAEAAAGDACSRQGGGASSSGLCPAVQISYLHTNTFKRKDLGECFSRNAEGLVKNMLIHELALLVDFHGITSARVAAVEVDPDLPNRPFDTELLEIDGRKDFSRLAVRLRLQDGAFVSAATLFADRCGARNSGVASVLVPDDSVHGDGVPVGGGGKASPMLQLLEARMHAGPDAQAAFNRVETVEYLVQQWGLYRAVKSRLLQHVQKGEKGAPPGLATLDTAIEALRLAELITEQATKQVEARLRA